MSQDSNLFFAKILNAQELGFRKDEPGQAGRYVYISKQLANFLPPLSDSVKNDHLILDVVPSDSNKIVLTNFVYHNDKIAENKVGGRDEYRLYLNDGIDPGGKFFEPGDIILIQKYISDKLIIFKLYKIAQKEKFSVYKKLENLINIESKIPGKSSAIIQESQLSFIPIETNFDLKTNNIILPEEVKRAVFAEPVVFENHNENELTKRLRSGNFREFVLLFYNYKCAITGTRNIIEYENLSNLEAAHIHSFAHNGSDNPSNGIPLTRDLHWAFDNGFITISSDYKVMVHKMATKNGLLNEIDGKGLLLPEDSRALPNLESIKWHNDNVFGSFIRKVDIR